MIKFTICTLKPRLGGDFNQSDVITHKSHYRAQWLISPSISEQIQEFKIHVVIVKKQITTITQHFFDNVMKMIVINNKADGHEKRTSIV